MNDKDRTTYHDTARDRQAYLDTIEQRFFKDGVQFRVVGRATLRTILHDAIHTGALLYADSLDKARQETREDGEHIYGG